MSVIKVTRDWNLSVHEEVVLEANQIPKIKMDTSLIFTVEFDSGDDPLLRPFLARNATDGTTEVPAMWSGHPYDPWLFVKSKDVKTIGPFLYEVTCKYDCQIDAETQLPLSPLMEPPEISWTFSDSNEPTDTDTEGKPITNSAGESFDPPITKDYSDLILRYTRNEETFDELIAADYKDAVNSDTFLGFGAGHVLCKMFEADQMRAADLTYYRVRYEFRIRYDEVKTRDGSGNIQTYIFGWIKRIRDEGYRETTGEENQDGSPEIDEIEDKNSVKISQPCLLDGSGNRLSDANIKNPPLPETCFLKFDIYKKRPFSALNI